ncbi:hypothetical protein DVA67_018550 [Solirubrobacter sp. CPCC 204708]|uniref:asparagine synthase (glutamine-hydrolyzing) n=1 Tax=Solirubrobacter deserti TaxID=2282478 RepID=A0ABT4RMD1_9ACTN|nr:asparagine synthase-related protein [Solirubrobacter deserti]MBE2317988.1 hypothetical protein [Solirubrobacter deserti]MDA0139667.1 asparagine synthase-related protein [Solirubrobacter deserti]
MIAAILDPGGRRAGPEAALRRAGATAVARFGAMWLGWTGGPPLEVDGVTVLVDGPAGERAASLLAGAARGRPPAPEVPTGLAWAAAEDRGAAVRDLTGARPLFVRREGEVTYLASEVRELLALLPGAPGTDDEAAALWLAMEPLGQRTLYAGVAPVPAGHWRAFDAASARRYWQPAPESLSLGREAAAERVWTALREAVGPCVRAAERPAVRLSGGLDSSAVLAAAIAEGVVPAAVSTVFPQYPEADEAELIAAVAGQLGAPSRTFAAGPRDLLADGAAFLARWGVPQEYPGRGLFHPMLEAAAAAHDVVLDGEGGDELFGCEPFLLADLVRHGRLAAARRVAHRLPGAPERLPARAYRVIARRWVAGPLAPARLRPPARVGADLDWFADAMTPRARAAVRARRAQLDWRSRPGPRWLARRIALIVTLPAEAGSADYLRRVTAMAGVSGASPLTDRRLVETVLSLPPEHAFDRRRDKELLRTALAGHVPDVVRLRAEKSHFGDAVLDNLDRAALLERLTPDLAPYLDVARVRRQVQAGPDAHPRGRAGWMFESWRAAMLATFLTR